MRIPPVAGRSNHSILKEINPDYSLVGLVLKLQYLGYLMQSTNSLEKTLLLGKIEGKRRRGQQRIRWLDIITNSLDMNLSGTEESGMLQSMGSQRAEPTEQQQIENLS